MGLADARKIAVAFALACACLGVPAVRAHEIGTTQVHVTFSRDAGYTIDVVTAPRSLLNRLEVASHQPRSAPLPPLEAQRRLETLAPLFATQTDVRFDGRRVAPNVRVLPIVAPADPSQPSFVVVRLSGPIPPKSSAFTWRYGWTYAAYALQLPNETQWLDGDAASRPFPLSTDVLPPTRIAVARQYLALGYTHIVPYGLDHILFVLGVFLLTTKRKPILLQVTAFTIAHSITLGLTIYGLVHVSPRIVEPMIALSIVYVAVENLVTSKLHPWRVAIVFAFGLLHGMGFAGVLREMGLPRSEFLTALITFNVGVEAGQLSVIAAAFLLVAYWHRSKPWYRHRFVLPASAAIAAVGVFWTVQRL